MEKYLLERKRVEDIAEPEEDNIRKIIVDLESKLQPSKQTALENTIVQLSKKTEHENTIVRPSNKIEHENTILQLSLKTELENKNVQQSKKTKFISTILQQSRKKILPINISVLIGSYIFVRLYICRSVHLYVYPFISFFHLSTHVFFF